jgi:hypothetical protein
VNSASLTTGAIVAIPSIESIKTDLDALNTLLESGDIGPAKAALDALRDRLKAGRPASRAAASAPRGLETFFDEVGRGMLAAQQQLDQASFEYNAQAQANGVQPTAFRIPRASAEFQFGTESTESGGFDLLILSSEHTTKDSITQKVSFDVVAVPPPPEVMLALSQERAGLRGLLEGVRNDADASESERDLARLLIEHLKQARWLRGDRHSLLCWVQSRDTGEVDEVLLALFSASVETPLVARLPVSKLSKNLSRLFSALAPLANAS